MLHQAQLAISAVLFKLGGQDVGWQIPFGWRAPHQVTLVPVPVALAKRPVVVELVAAQRQQGSGAARQQQQQEWQRQRL